MDETDARLAALFPDPPWRLPEPLGAPESGDAEIDALLLALDRPASEANAIDATQRALLADPRRATVHVGARRWLERITAERALPRGWEAQVTAPVELARAKARVAEARPAWNQRTWLAQNLVAQLAIAPDAGTRQAMLEWVTRPSDARVQSALATGLLGSLPDEGPERVAVLDVLVSHLVPADPLAPFGAEARVLRDGDAARPAIARVLATCDDFTRVAIAVRLSTLDRVDFDARPEWVDVLYPDVLGRANAIAASYRLQRVATAEPILRALAYTDAEPSWADMLMELRRVDDPGSATRLEVLASSLPEAPKGKRLQRSKGAVLALVKYLRRKRGVVPRASLTFSPGVGTDGGPILVVSRDAARSWAGVPVGWDGPGRSDYDRACASSEAGVGAITIGGRASLAISSVAIETASLAGGKVLLALEGTALSIEAALAEARAWKKKPKLVLEVGDEGAVLLDATRTLTSAGGAADEDALATLAMAPGRYDVLELSRADAAGHVRALQLVPAASRGAEKRAR